ncbi:MAG TPA: SPFH domain-containing protein [Candidatus Bathyarchaeia archaeon]|nr:SPFH domain-containing protein [Candidatus Bathyarchaeia archaeon]
MRQEDETPQYSRQEEFVANLVRELNNFKSGLLPILSIGIVLIIIFNCFVYVKPNEFGIKQVNIGFKTGIQEKIYETGLHFLMPIGIEVMHRFPRDVQVLELTNYLESASRGARREKAAHIQTSDGFFVDVDVTMLYRIADPYKVITTIGPGRLFEDNAIIPKAESKLKEALGEMTTEEFYNSPLREKKASYALELLNKELNPKGIIVGHILVRYFRYSTELQRNIEEKKLKDQLVFTNQSKAKASAEEALVKKAQQEGEANIKVTMEQGKAYVMKKNAEKDLYARSKKAEADLLVNLADARKTELINLAYQNNGSDKLVGLKMAEVYKGIEVIMLPSSGQYGINPLDLENSLRIFGVGQGKENHEIKSID